MHDGMEKYLVYKNTCYSYSIYCIIYNIKIYNYYNM